MQTIEGLIRQLLQGTPAYSLTEGRIFPTTPMVETALPFAVQDRRSFSLS